MVPDAEPPHDPFTIKPPDPESVAMEDALRRKGMRFGFIIGAIGCLGLLAGVASGIQGDLVRAAYTGGIGMAFILWGTTHYFKIRSRDY